MGWGVKQVMRNGWEECGGKNGQEPDIEKLKRYMKKEGYGDLADAPSGTSEYSKFHSYKSQVKKEKMAEAETEHGKTRKEKHRAAKQAFAGNSPLTMKQFKSAMAFMVAIGIKDDDAVGQAHLFEVFNPATLKERYGMTFDELWGAVKRLQSA